MEQQQVKPRIELIDALRGFALFGILLIHGVEHFNFFHRPEKYLLFTRSFDQAVCEVIFFMISQKAYSIFALMFGISFHIQMKNQKDRGNDFSLRFAWRLFILMILGIIHSSVYNGDILFVYAVIGFLLIPINKLNTKTLWVLVILFALQLPFIYQLVSSFLNTGYEILSLRPLISGKELMEVYANADFIDVVKTNIIKGKSRSIIWSYNTGRLYQLVSLFVAGVIIGRTNLLTNIKQKRKMVLYVLVTSVILSLVLWLAENSITNYNITGAQKRLLKVIISSYYNLSFTVGLISLFIAVYIITPTGKLFKHFAVYGRMSLTNYLSQTIIGGFFFYGYGFAMYKYMGFTWGLIYALLFAVIQIKFSYYWLNRFYYGPVEWIWRALTLFDFTLKFRKKKL